MPQILSELAKRMPVQHQIYHKKPGDILGLVMIDAINGFAKPGAGALAPHDPNPQIERMIAEVGRLSAEFEQKSWPIFVFQDTHFDDRPEPPYPPHCIQGSGEEELVESLKWLQSSKNATFCPKSCINSFIGAFNPKNLAENKFVSWAEKTGVTHLVVTGIATDICVMDFVLTILSVRNAHILPKLKEVLVYEPGCATFELTEKHITQFKLPHTVLHPQKIAHHMGLYFMASRGAMIIDALKL